MAFRMKFTFSKTADILDTKYNGAKTTGYKLQHGNNVISNLSLMLKSLFPNEVNVIITIDDYGLASNLTTNKAKKSYKRVFFYAILGFFQSHLGPLDDPPEITFKEVQENTKAGNPNTLPELI